MIRWIGLQMCLAVVAAAGAESPPPEVEAAMAELWRRGHCLLSSVDRPAARESVLPKDIGATPVLAPRLLAGKGALLCYAVDAPTLWAADDQALYRADAKAGRLVKRYDRSDGLPDEIIQSIAAGGNAVWLATRGGLCGLDLRTGRIAPVGNVRFSLGRLAGGAGGSWLVTDAGAWRLAPGSKRWQKLPDFPGQGKLARIVRHGFWSAWWQQQLDTLIPSIFPDEGALYVIVVNDLLRYDVKAGQWKRISAQAWQALAEWPAVWALTTTGVCRYDPATGKSQSFPAGKGPAAGRPAAMAGAKGALFVASEPDYDPKAGRYVGGGISRYDPSTGEWTITEAVDDVDIRFTRALWADGDEAWAACTLYDKVVQLSAHPGMAHVKRFRPRACGLGLLHYAAGRWALIQGKDLPTERRWVMGQKGKVAPDHVAPNRIDRLCRCGGRLWGVYRMVPRRYYSGYYVSAGCLAAESGGRWRGRFDLRTAQLALTGEQPDLMLISHSHGVKIVLAEGHPIVLGIERIAGRAWAVCQSGLFVHDPASDEFAPVVREGSRIYWQATSAAAAKDAVWFGGDGGTISRLDRATGRLELVGVVPARKIVSMTPADDGVVARTAQAKVSLPADLRGAPRLPAADSLHCRSGGCVAGSGGGGRVRPGFRCRRKSSYLYEGDRRIGFLKGAFRPVVLCEDPVGKKLWLSTHSGVASVPLPADVAN